jgi:hypothetical protein
MKLRPRKDDAAKLLQGQQVLPRHDCLYEP